MTLAMYIFSNRQLLKELKEDSDDNETKMKNIINAVNYNDTKLMENQKYLYDVYEENNNFEDVNNTTNTTSIENTDQYYNMMKNYDALIRLTK
tara:strand:+ start:3210 stop:3488 length:279 start_codon:yes stop_codon:yes gene_type:complete